MPSDVNIGLMFSFRRTDPRRSFVEVYRDDLGLIRDAEQLGFDTIWLTEHHFAEDGYSPAIIPIAAAVAAMTERIRIGFNLLLLPLHHAVQLAENLATVDVISNGRLDVGLGQGYAEHEFAGYGIPRSQRLSRFLEGLDVLNGLWTNEVFSFQGKHYHVDSARLVPRPVQQPSPPIWIGATSEKAIRRAGRRGADLLGLANPALQAAYEDGRREAGLTLDTAKVLQLHWVHVGESDDEAWAEAGEAFHHLLTVYWQWAKAAADVEGSRFPVPQVPPVAELRRGEGRTMFRPVIGSSEHVAGLLSASMDTTLTTHLAFGVLPGIDPQHTAASMRRVITDIAPALKARSPHRRWKTEGE
jgi:alkanesulfonate monooxygenase SsuD/methylene tetrahydromethanopterin reductase-like flavin-dependent oxidoreductase (luciferase family)